jgi:hypothetical protein
MVHLVPHSVADPHVGLGSAGGGTTRQYTVPGHPAGVAAAMAAKSGKPVRELDIPALARKLAAERQALDRGGAIPSTQDR